MKSIAILGRQPALGIAELESLYGPDKIQKFGKFSCFIDIDHQNIDFLRLGGSIRLAQVVKKLSSSSWSKTEKELEDYAVTHAENINGKLIFGVSTFGVDVSPKKLARTALNLKKSIKSSGNSVRMVPHDKLELNSATVLYNKLTSENGLELLVVSDGSETYLARTTNVQDIDAYSARDQARPHRDAKVGMLPPKLAQIIVNLSVGQTSAEKIRTRLPGKTGAETSSAERRIDNTSNEQHSVKASLDGKTNSSNQALLDSEIGGRIRILDPFCGTGVVLQEAMLMDFDIYGTDLEPRMIQYSIDNLKWLDEKYPNVGDYRRIEVGDATNFKWYEPEKITNVAAETYLGQPLSSLPASEHLSKIIYEVNLLHHKFLENIASQIKPGTRLCLAVPTWRGKREFLHLPTLDYLDDLGYTRMRFKHADDENLIYHRENQVVGRELLVLEKR